KAIIQQWWSPANSSNYYRGKKTITDEHGHATLPLNNSDRYLEMELSFYYDKDSLFFEHDENRDETSAEVEYTPQADSLKSERINTTTSLFTDRSIYRPGQTVYFKGISITKDWHTRKNKLYTNQKSRVMLSDVNGTDLDSMDVTSNAFGSFSGRFRLPLNQLNGRFTISNKYPDNDSGVETSDVSFSVEEYKRPKFYVQLDTIKGSYRINDSITVTGFAKAYAGNAIDGAKVSFRVQRLTRFIYSWFFWPHRPPPRNDMEITNGVISTSPDGSFRLRFKAIPDLSVDKGLDPVFDYSVSVDITDAAGETHSGETTMQVSYKTIQLGISFPVGESMAADSFHLVILDTHNNAGEFIPAPATVTITRLQAPNRLIRERYWPEPDKFVMSKEEYLSIFPLDEYKDELDRYSWPKEKIAWQASDSTGPSKQFNISSRLPEGWYIVEAVARDINGDSVKNVQYLHLFDENSPTLATPAYTWTAYEDMIAEPGEHARIRIGSSADSLYVIQQVDKERGEHEKREPAGTYSFLRLSNEKKTIDFISGEDDRGGFGVYHFFIKNNRFYSLSNKVHVPWSNKQLSIQYETFRDKTLPGSEEKWRLKISGPKKEKVAAEMLASMYDASLDQFKPHEWRVPSIFDTYRNDFGWEGENNFGSVSSEDENRERDGWKQAIPKQYEELITGLRKIQYADGSTRAITLALDNKRELESVPTILAVPDWSKDPDGSKAYTQDSAVTYYRSNMEDRSAPMMAGLAASKIGFSKAYFANGALNASRISVEKEGQTQSPVVQIRKNFNETAFFFPDLQTDSAGDISFGFTMPEALTQWKFQALAHTKDLAFGYTSTTVVTQKPLMVQPNAPRFLREGDRMDFSAKVVNLTDKEQTGTVQLELLNAITNESADGWFRNMYPVQYFTAEAGQSTVVKFSIDVPYQYNSALVYRFVAKAGDNSDGEEASLPVLTNTMLVTESMPLPVRGNGSRNFKFEKLLQSGNSETLQQHALTIEFTSNPAWYAVQALPYLADYPYEC
ncbi:MAG TPA: alpha-2-macroglobulin family protein, partial [Chitinophagaceae bacterium]